MQKRQGEPVASSVQGSIEAYMPSLADAGPSLPHGAFQLQAPSLSNTLDEVQELMSINVDAEANNLLSHYSLDDFAEIDPLMLLDTDPASMEPFWGSHSSKVWQPPLDSTPDGDGASPVVSFLGSPLSPEPQLGQAMGFHDMLHKSCQAFRQVHDMQVGVDNPLDTDSFPTSTTQPGLEIWRTEDLGHVRKLPRLAYQDMISNYGKLNRDDGYHLPFANGDFPSLAAMNVFMQLYFEEVHHLLPFLHRPTFDPAEEHWILILALAAVGCRFSKVQGALICASLLQEFLRRALKTMVYVFCSAFLASILSGR